MSIIKNSLISGFTKVLSANIVVLVVGLIISFIIPMSLSTDNYGYLQLFTLYLAYNGFFILGFNDGIHLNYAGVIYDKTLFLKFRTFVKVVAITSLIGVFIVVLLSLLFGEGEKQFIFIMTGVSIIIVGLNGFTSYTNQNTFRFSRYSQSILIEKIVYFILVILLVYMKSDNYKLFVYAIFISSLIKLIFNLITSHEIFFFFFLKIRELKSEIVHNFQSGFAVMITLILYSSINTGGRLLIERYMGIEKFGVFSFALNTLVIATVFFTAISQVFYPILAKIKDNMHLIQDNIDEILFIVSIILLFSYFPVYFLIKTYYEQYTSLLNYLTLLYPLFIFKGKYLVLIMNGLKVTKRLKVLIINSIIGIVANSVLTAIAIFLFNSMFYVALAFLISHIIWYYYGLINYNRAMNIKHKYNQYLDLLIVSAFLTATTISSFIASSIISYLVLGVLFQLVILIIYIFVKKDKLIVSISVIKNLRGEINYDT